ncbi:hypothetical protein DZK27_02365 [Rhodobacteraceae bacterium 63075]|nr:hypothetical protein DZK27_02365 [Rhodobacteraceae bacterium 63075]
MRLNVLLVIFSIIGLQASAGDYKAFGRIEIIEKGGSSYYCDGTVIGSRYVLTSASCIRNADFESDLIEFIPGYIGEFADNPRRYVVSKAWIPKDFDRSVKIDATRSAIRANFAVLEAHSLELEKWIGQVVDPFAFDDRWNYQELRDRAQGDVVLVSFQSEHKLEARRCAADFAGSSDHTVYNTNCDFWNFAIGSPALEKVGDHYVLTSVVSGSDRTDDTLMITQFGRFINSIKAVVAGKEQSEFRVHDVNWAGTSKLMAKNACDTAEDLRMYAVYKDYFSGELRMKSTKIVKPGDTINFSFRTKARKIYFRAESSTIDWGGSDGDAHHYSIDGRSEPFFEISFDRKEDGSRKWNDEKVSLTCGN